MCARRWIGVCDPETRIWGYGWLDPVVGIGGAILVAVWAFGLLRQTGAALLDREMDHPVVDEIRELFEPDHAAHGTSITDLHVTLKHAMGVQNPVSGSGENRATSANLVTEFLAGGA